MKASTLIVLVTAALLLTSPAEGQIDPATLRPVGYHPSNVTYFNTPYFANALAQGSEWYSFSNFEFGTLVDYNTTQFQNGYPKFLNAGQKLRALLFGLNTNYAFRPPGWPARDTLTKGRVVVTWKGTADIRLVKGTFVASGSSGAETGNLVDGRRIYLCTGANESTQSIEVQSMATPLTEIRVWLPAVDDPATSIKENETSSLENQLFHPLLLRRIADADWAFIRFMDWGMTNASPQQDWIDRRVPGHIFMGGIINPREPAAGVQGNRETGVAFENMVALCNATGKNLWINVPHLATADFTTRLAKLIMFGSDGVNPYDTPQTNPVFAPLNANLKVFVEFSNEIWSSGFSFPQGNFAQDQAAAQGITKAQFNARRFCDTWRIFQQVFGGTTRLVRVAAIFTALDSYSRPFMQEIGTYGAALSPAVRPDVMAVTTYFGNGIQDFVNQQGFTTGKLFDDPYWTGPLFATHLRIAFDEWKRRILAGDAAQGSGPDATAIGGGFASTLRTLPNETLGYSLPLIAYEGGPSLFTDTIDQNATNAQGVPTDDGVTTFIEAMNRDPRIADVYRIHLDIAKSKGLWTHTPYTDTVTWSRFGQWGHLETLDQLPANSPKYSLMLEHFATFSALRHIDTPVAAVPQFSTNAILPVGIAGQPYTIDILTTGGDGARTATVVGALLEPGMTIAAGPSAGTLRISGTPGTSRKNFIFARVSDGDGDPAWRIFTLQTFGGAGTLVQSDFRGTSPGLALPWTTTFVLSPKVTWSGWTVGAGVTPSSGDNALVFSVSAPSTANETLTQAIAGNKFLKATTTPAQGALDLRGAEVRFSTRRIGFHSPLGYALFSSIGGFAEANALYVSSQVSKDNFDEVEHVVILPSTSAFSAVNTATEWRIVAFGAQFDGHKTSLTGFKLTEVATIPAPTLSSFTPASGAIGSPVVITGTNFTGTTAVRFNGIAAVTFTVDSATQITATVPNTATSGPISVVTGGGTATSATNFTVSTAAPAITNFTPASGAAGTNVTITGSNFTGATSVRFNGTTANTFAVVSATQVTATVPSGATTGPVSVVTGGGTATSATNFTVTAAAPTITSFTPASGAAGTTVTITGSNFTGATAVRFNGITATSFTVVSATQVTAAVPSGATTGPVSVVTPGGTATSSTSFTVTSLPSGDANGDGGVTVGDVFYLINTLFTGGPAAVGPADANGDGQITVADVFYLINFLFSGGPAPR